MIPLDSKQRWNLSATASTAVVDYLPGLSQPGNWQTGLGGGVLQIAFVEDHVRIRLWRGCDPFARPRAQSVGLLLQSPWESQGGYAQPEQPGRWRGFQEMFDIFGK